jgi:hypothetical protein
VSNAVHARASYAWRDLRFDLPAGLDDDTLVTFTAPDGSHNVTLTRDALPGPLDAYARAQEQALAARTTTKDTRVHALDLGGRSAVVVDRVLPQKRGEALVQRQLFVSPAPGIVAVVTSTSTASSSSRAHEAALALARSLTCSTEGGAR